MRTGPWLISSIFAACALNLGWTAAAFADASPIRWNEHNSYSYTAAQVDQLGIPGTPSGAGILPSGAVFTPSVEVVPWLGDGRVGIKARRNLPDPTVPLFATEPTSRGATAAWWATDVVGVPAAVIALDPVQAQAGVALRWGGTQTPGAAPRAYEYTRPTPPNSGREGLFTQPGEPLVPGECWSAHHAGRLLVIKRGLSVVAVIAGAALSTGPVPGANATPCPRSPQQYAISLRLRRRSRREPIDVIVPLAPLSASDQHIASSTANDVRRSGVQLARSWRKRHRNSARIHLPEAGVQRAYDASLVNLLVPRYHAADGTWIQTVNMLNYHAFWLRDMAMQSHALDLAGMPDVAAQDIEFARRWQSAAGEFNSRIGQRDGFGQALWAIGQHALLTNDPAYARSWLAAVRRAVDWAQGEMQSGASGVLPASVPNDDERVNGILSGDQFWGVAGLAAASDLARVAGDSELQASADAARAALQRRVVALVRQQSVAGLIPPALNVLGGFSWGEQWAAWPYPVLPARDPLVLATAHAAVSRQAEGVATYGKYLHLYTGFRTWQTLLRAGDQRTPVQGLYSTIAHMTATGGGFETDVLPYRTRDARRNLTPHGWLAAEIVTLVHDLLAHEQNGRLVLMSAVPDAWLASGQTTSARRLPTAYGPITLRFHGFSHGAKLGWNLRSRGIEPQLIFPLPPSVIAASVSGDGTLSGREVILGPSHGSVVLRWTRQARQTSLKQTIRVLQAGYRNRRLKPPS